MPRLSETTKNVAVMNENREIMRGSQFGGEMNSILDRLNMR